MIVALLRVGLAFFRAALFRRRAWRALAIPAGVEMSATEKRRFYHYFFGTTYLAVLFMTLLRRERSPRERRLFVRMAALAAFFDDLSERQMKVAASDLEEYGRLADPRGLALHFLQNIRRELTLEQTPVFEKELKKVFDHETGRERLSDLEAGLWLTGDKGAHSVLLFRAVLTPAPNEEEYRFLHSFGRLIQLCDDIFDVWFDCCSSTRRSTIASYCFSENDLTGLIRVFEHLVVNTRKLILDSDLPNKKQAWATVYLLVALTRVALRHYRRVQARFVDMPYWERKIMVVDMGLWRNRFRFVGEVLRKNGALSDLSEGER